MSVEIKDVIHLYMGCGVLAPDPETDDTKYCAATLTGIHGEYEAELQFIRNGNASEHPEYCNFSLIQPILRRLGSMTNEEAKEYGETTEFYPATPSHGHLMVRHQTPETFRWLLSKGFWVFGDDAFDKGLIIAKDTLK